MSILNTDPQMILKFLSKHWKHMISQLAFLKKKQTHTISITQFSRDVYFTPNLTL